MCVSLSTSLSSLFISLIGVNDSESFDVISGMKITSIGSLRLDSTRRKLYFWFPGIYYKQNISHLDQLIRSNTTMVFQRTFRRTIPHQDTSKGKNELKSL